MKTNLTLILVAFCLIIGSVSYATEDVPAPSKPPKAYVTRLLGARETIHRLKDEERGAKRLCPAAWGPAAPAAFGTRTAATTSWLPPAPPAPYVVAPPRLV